jgi:hypothetical protein
MQARDPGESERATLAQQLANDCRRLASTELEPSTATLFEKLARLFEEAAAVQRWHAARQSSCGEFDWWC